MELRGLVSELDEKLAAARHPTNAANELGVGPRTTVREWARFGAIGFAAGAVIIAALALLGSDPWRQDCRYTTDVCEIAELDIDALRVAIPNSELIAALPDIDALDPQDELTAGDIFAMDRFAHINFEELLTEQDIALLLGATR